MPPNSFNRRDFIRRGAALTAGSLGAAAGLTTGLTGCGSESTRPVPVPPTPSNLVAQVVSSSEIILSWQDTSSGEAGFEIQRKTGSEAAFTPLATLDAGNTSYQDTSVVETTLYVYRLRAFKGSVFSDYSSEASVQTPSSAAPLTPRNARAEAVTSSGSRLKWDDASSNEHGFRISRVDGGNLTTVGSLPSDAVEFQMAGLEAGQVHTFVIVAFNDAGDSAVSNEIRVRTDRVSDGLVLDAGSPGIIGLSWQDRTGGAVSFVVERKTDDSPFAIIGSTPSGTTTFLDSQIIPGARHAYRVLSRDEFSILPEEQVLEVPSEVPLPPLGFGAALSAQDGSHVILTWTYESAADGFEIERRAETTAFSSLQRIKDPRARVFEDIPGTPFAVFAYRIRAFNLAGYSDYSNVVQAVTRATFFLTGSLAVLRTVGKGATVSLPFPPARVGSMCSHSMTNLWLIRVSDAAVSAVVAHCTHACLSLPFFRHDEPNQRFQCAHGSQFDWFGRLLRGPAGQSVPTVPAELFEDRVELSRPDSGQLLAG